MRTRRLGMVIVALAFLIVGVGIGRLIPPPIPRKSSGYDEAPRSQRTIARPLNRNVYSPDIRHDEYFREEQRKLLEMIERQCRFTGKHCDVAKSLRASLTKD